VELNAVFARPPKGDPLRLTEAGLFLATPLDVLVAACAALLQSPGLSSPERMTVLDAGSGDGRVLGALGLLAPASRPLRLVGIECDRDLHLDSCDRLAALARRPTWPAGRGAALLHGDWTAPDAFASLGLGLADFDLVLNYPDGSEARLAGELARRGRPGGRLALIQPDPPREQPGCHLEWQRAVVVEPGAPRWYVSLQDWRS